MSPSTSYICIGMCVEIANRNTIDFNLLRHPSDKGSRHPFAILIQRQRQPVTNVERTKIFRKTVPPPLPSSRALWTTLENSLGKSDDVRLVKEGVDLFRVDLKSWCAGSRMLANMYEVFSNASIICTIQLVTFLL